VGGAPTIYTDPEGLYLPGVHNSLSYTQAQGTCLKNQAIELGNLTGGVDGQPGSQLPENSHRHNMCTPGTPPDECRRKIQNYIQEELQKCSLTALANALHAIQDGFAAGHKGGKSWHGMPWDEGGESWGNSAKHFAGDLIPAGSSPAAATKSAIVNYCNRCKKCDK